MLSFTTIKMIATFNQRQWFPFIFALFSSYHPYSSGVCGEECTVCVSRGASTSAPSPWQQRWDAVMEGWGRKRTASARATAPIPPIQLSPSELSCLFFIFSLLFQQKQQFYSPPLSGWVRDCSRVPLYTQQSVTVNLLL